MGDGPSVTGTAHFPGRELIMAPRPKNNITYVASALDKLQAARAALGDIDLRTTRGELRDAIREGRLATENALEWCEAAIQADAATLAAHTHRRAG